MVAAGSTSLRQRCMVHVHERGAGRLLVSECLQGRPMRMSAYAAGLNTGNTDNTLLLTSPALGSHAPQLELPGAGHRIPGNIERDTSYRTSWHHAAYLPTLSPQSSPFCHFQRGPQRWPATLSRTTSSEPLLRHHRPLASGFSPWLANLRARLVVPCSSRCDSLTNT